jgi:TolA-binding protein
VRNFPTGNKAADAAYRQGEALLQMGPGYDQAARNAFERVLKSYPDSSRAAEAKRQLELLGSG